MPSISATGKPDEGVCGDDFVSSPRSDATGISGGTASANVSADMISPPKPAQRLLLCASGGPAPSGANAVKAKPKVASRNRILGGLGGTAPMTHRSSTASDLGERVC